MGNLLIACLNSYKSLLLCLDQETVVGVRFLVSVINGQDMVGNEGT